MGHRDHRVLDGQSFRRSFRQRFGCIRPPNDLMHRGSLNNSINEPLRGLAFADWRPSFGDRGVWKSELQAVTSPHGLGRRVRPGRGRSRSGGLVEVLQRCGVGVSFRTSVCRDGLVDQNGPALASDRLLAL
jgi:hypothetical protein